MRKGGRCKILFGCIISIVYFHVGESSEHFAVTETTQNFTMVSRQEIWEAMRSQSGYDPTATTNVARFQAEVILKLAYQAREKHPDGPPLFIGHTEWFRAFLKANNLTIDNAPIFARLAYEHRQDQLVDYHRDSVIQKFNGNEIPRLALNVKIFWPKTPESPSKFSFQDTLSTPKLKVTSHRVITYRLIDFGDMLVYDEINGITGRPTSGILGLLFKFIGESRVSQSKIIISKDGLQINRAQANKGMFKVTSTMTVHPNGHTEKGLPKDRPELPELEKRLKQPLRLKYVPFQWPELCLSKK